MDIITQAGALFDNHPRRKNKTLLLDIDIVNFYANSNLENAARHAGKHIANAVERNKNKYRGSFPATYSLLPPTMSTCGEVGSDVYALIEELTIRRVEYRSEIHSNESQHLAEGTEVARLWCRFSFVLQQTLPFRTRHHLCRQGVALTGTRQLRSQGLVSVHAHRTEGVTGSEGREGVDGVEGGIGVGAGNGNGDGNGGGGGGGNGDVNGDGDGDGAGTRTGVEANEGTRNGNWDGSDGRARTGTGTGRGETHRRTQDGNGDGSGDGNESSSGDGNEDEDGNGDGNEGGIGEGRGEAKKLKKPHKSCRRNQALSFRTRDHLSRQRGGACGHPTAPFARSDVCTRALHREGNLVRETGRSERGRGRDKSRGWEWGRER